MTNEVWVSVCGVHETDGESVPIQTVSPGSYRLEDGQHKISYEESADGAGQVMARLTVSRPLKLADGETRCVDFLRNAGGARTRMRFLPERRQKVNYRTPYGPIAMETETHDVTVVERENFLRVQIRYDLEVQGQSVSACTLTVEVTPRGANETERACA